MGRGKSVSESGGVSHDVQYLRQAGRNANISQIISLCLCFAVSSRLRLSVSLSPSLKVILSRISVGAVGNDRSIIMEQVFLVALLAGQFS